MKITIKALFLIYTLLAAAPAYSMDTWSHVGQCFALFESVRQRESDPASKIEYKNAVARSQRLFIRLSNDMNKPIDISSPEEFHKDMLRYLMLFVEYNNKLTSDERKQLTSDCVDEFM